MDVSSADCLVARFSCESVVLLDECETLLHLEDLGGEARSSVESVGIG